MRKSKQPLPNLLLAPRKSVYESLLELSSDIEAQRNFENIRKASLTQKRLRKLVETLTSATDAQFDTLPKPAQDWYNSQIFVYEADGILQEPPGFVVI